MNVGDKIYNFITSVQNFINKARYVWPYCCDYYCYYTCYSYTWDWQISYAISGITDINHIWIQYAAQQFTSLY